MKILMTGGSSKQVKPKELRGGGSTDNIDVPHYIVESLTAAGHSVDWRAVRPGEDLSEYDLLWIGWQGWLSRTSPNSPGALWALQQEDIARVCFFDDWRWQQGWSHARTILKDLEKYVPRSDFWGGALKLTDEELRDAIPIVKRGCEFSLDMKAWEDSANFCVVVPMYGWGDMEVVRDAHYWNGAKPLIARLDPTGYVVAEELLSSGSPIELTTKSKEWSMGSLSPQKDWVEKQRLRWWVNYYGHRKSGLRLKTERDIFDAYSASGGILSARYSHLVGAGWFRSRWIYGALSQTFVASDTQDRIFDDDPSPREFEKLTESERAWFAERQSDYMLELAWDTEHFDNQVAAIVREIV